MPASSKHRKPASRRATSRSRNKKLPPSVLLLRGLRCVWHLLPVIALLVVILAGLTIDPAGLAGLIWACVTGSFGRTAQIGTALTVLAAAGAIAWAFWPEATPAPPQRRPRSRPPGAATKRPASAPESPGRPRPAKARPEPQDAAIPEAADAAPAADPAPAGKPRRRAASSAREPGQPPSRPATIVR